MSARRLQVLKERFARWPRSPLAWLGLAALYAALILLRSGEVLYGDELRYVEYARNLTEGFYAAPPPTGRIRNGPGLPLLLAPFVAFGGEGTALRFVNLPLLLGGVFLTHRLLRRASNEPLAALGTAFVALHPSVLLYGSRVLSEIPALYLLVGFGFFLERHVREPGSRSAAWLAALHLSLLALTKVTYAYGVAVVWVLFLVLRVHPRTHRRFFARASVGGVLALALLGCTPYLAYTWHQTGKLFYWGTNGGETLYWMSVEGEGLWGSWLKTRVVAEHPDLARAHLPFLRELRALPAVERDARFRERALANIAADPAVYARHWVANVSRLLFNVPYSRRDVSLGALVPGLAEPAARDAGDRRALAVGAGGRRRERWHRAPPDGCRCSGHWRWSCSAGIRCLATRGASSFRHSRSSCCGSLRSRQGAAADACGQPAPRRPMGAPPLAARRGSPCGRPDPRGKLRVCACLRPIRA